MARSIRIFDGKFGRLQLIETAAGETPQTTAAPQILIMREGADLDVLVDGEAQDVPGKD